MGEPAPHPKRIVEMPEANLSTDTEDTAETLRKRRRLTLPKAFESADHCRNAEIEKWTQFLLIAREERGGLARQIASEVNEKDQAATIAMTFADGAIGTFRRHACAMGIHIRWAKSMQLPIFPLMEQRTFTYVMDRVQAKVAPSRAQGFVHAAAFATHRLALFSGKAAYTSARIEGAITTSYDHKREAVEAAPLPVEAVRTLEGVLHDTSRPLGERHMAGFSFSASMLDYA